jgi:hypothetical protein
MKQAKWRAGKFQGGHLLRQERISFWCLKFELQITEFSDIIFYSLSNLVLVRIENVMGIYSHK